MRRIIPILLFLPALILITGLACGDSTSTETESRIQSRPTVAPRDAVIASGTSGAGYLLIAGNAIQTLGNSLQNLGALAGNPRIGEEDWTISVAVEAAGIELAYQELLELDPPQELADLHSAVLDAALDCKTGKDFFLKGVDNRDANSLERASELINSCGRKMDTAQSLLDQYLETSGQQDPSESSPRQDVPSQGNATVNNEANLREGPGTDFAVVGGAKQGGAIELVARNEAGDWYQLASGEWIAAFLVDNAPTSLPVASDIPEPGN